MDIPEASAEQLRYARRPGRGQARVLPVAIDADIVEWLRKKHGDDAEAVMTQVLRDHIAAATNASTKPS